MTSLYIVITESLGIILHIVDYISCHIASLGVDIIIEVAGRLSLKDIAIFQEDDIVLIGLAQIVYIRGYACQGSCLRFAIDEIVWEERTMDITRLNHSEFDGARLSHCLRIKSERQQERCE